MPPIIAVSFLILDYRSGKFFFISSIAAFSFLVFKLVNFTLLLLVSTVCPADKFVMVQFLPYGLILV